MKPARENHERLAGVADAVTVAAVDMAVAAKVASEEATDEFANHGSCGRDWAGLDSNQRRRKASRFTVCPVWPLRYLPVWTRGFSYRLALHGSQVVRKGSRVISNDE